MQFPGRTPPVGWPCTVAYKSCQTRPRREYLTIWTSVGPGLLDHCHGRGPRRIPRWGAGNRLSRGNAYARSHLLRGVFLSRTPGKTGSNTFFDGHELPVLPLFFYTAAAPVLIKWLKAQSRAAISGAFA